eukprot:1373145-Pleurochrysis_carterae.AAC.1
MGLADMSEAARLIFAVPSVHARKNHGGRLEETCETLMQLVHLHSRALVQASDVSELASLETRSRACAQVHSSACFCAHARILAHSIRSNALPARVDIRARRRCRALTCAQACASREHAQGKKAARREGIGRRVSPLESVAACAAAAPPLLA